MIASPTRFREKKSIFVLRSGKMTQTIDLELNVTTEQGLRALAEKGQTQKPSDSSHRGFGNQTGDGDEAVGLVEEGTHIDGAILNPGRSEPVENPGSMLRPEAIARTYRHLIEQDRSAWSNEVAVRPWVEGF